MGFFAKNRLGRLINKAQKIDAKSTDIRERVKDEYYKHYDRASVETLLDVLENFGHPCEKDFADRFRKAYKSNNIEVMDIKLFIEYFDSHKDEFKEERNKRGEDV